MAEILLYNRHKLTLNFQMSLKAYLPKMIEKRMKIFSMEKIIFK